MEPASIPVFIPPADRLLTNWPEASEYTVRVDLNTSAANTGESPHEIQGGHCSRAWKTPDVPVIQLYKRNIRIMINN